MIYGWIIGGLAALDLGVKSVVEGQEDDTFPRDLPSAKGFIKLHKNHNSGFPFGFMKERPELVKGIPLMVISAMAGALAAMMQDKGKTGEKLGLSLVMGGALSNLYDRVVRGYVVDYFTIEWKSLKKVVFNLGDMFVFLGSAVFGEPGRCGCEEEKEIRKNKARQRASDGREERMTGFHGHDWKRAFSLLIIN